MSKPSPPPLKFHPYSRHGKGPSLSEHIPSREAFLRGEPAVSNRLSRYVKVLDSFAFTSFTFTASMTSPWPSISNGPHHHNLLYLLMNPPSPRSNSNLPLDRCPSWHSTCFKALIQRTCAPMTEQMGQPMPPITERIEWCRQRSRQARSEPEADAWQAEADGLRDAVMNRDHSVDYQLCSAEIRGRYLLGLQDGIAMLQTTRMKHANRAADPRIPQQAPQVERMTQSGDE